MMQRWQALWSAILVWAMTAPIALAQFVPAPAPPPPTGGVGVPGPIAGAGLPLLVIGGGYYLVRRWRKRGGKD